MKDSQALIQELKALEEKRKNREISAREFYKGLLEILAHLKDVLAHENIDENQIRKQIPLLLAFIKSQISELEARGH
jgi:hypothetical protein